MAATTPRVGRSVLWIILTRVVGMPLALLQGAILARVLQPQGLGRYSALLVDINLGVTILSLGLPGALSVLVGERLGRLLPLLRYALRHGLLLVLVPGGLLSLLSFLLPQLPARIARSEVEIALVALACAVQYVRDVLSALLLGSQRFQAQNLQAVVLSVLQVALCVGLVGAGRLDPRTAIGVQIFSNVVLCGLSAHALIKVVAEVRAGGEAKDPAEPDLGRRIRQIGGRNFLHILPDLLIMRIDVYLMQRLLPPGSRDTQLGIYQAGVRIAEMVLLLPTALNAVLFAKSAAREELTSVTIGGAKLALYLGLFCLLGMGLVGQPLLILIFGARFAGSFVPCLLVLLGCAALCMSVPLGGTLSGAGAYPRSIIVVQGAALLVNVVANLILIPRYGAIGAAASSTLAYTVSATILSIAFSLRFSVPLREILRPESPWALVRRLRAH